MHDKVNEPHPIVAQPHVNQIDPAVIQKLSESVNSVHRDLKTYANNQVNLTATYILPKFVLYQFKCFFCN